MDQKTIQISRKKLVWVLLVIIVIGLALVYSGNNAIPGLRMMGNDVAEQSSGSAPAMPPMVVMDGDTTSYPVPDYYPGNPDITDTRQFLKTSYSANIRTRDVKDLVRDVKGIISEADGRIDSLEESEKHSYIRFVVPKSKFDAFRDEIEALAPEKLITINLSSENQLGQKQSIEKQRETTTASLAQWEAERAALTSKHNQTLAGQNAELSSIQSQLTILRASLNATTSESERLAFQNQITVLLNRDSAIRQAVAVENQSYNSQNQNLTARIDQAKRMIAGADTRDVQFTNNLETVDGFISINWVSYWDMVALISPIHPSILLLILLLIIWRLLVRFKLLPKIQLV